MSVYRQQPDPIFDAFWADLVNPGTKRIMTKSTIFTFAAALFVAGCQSQDSPPSPNAQSHMAANMQSHMDRYQYQCWEGGPHILIPNAVASAWAGQKSGVGALDPNTDYGRACQVQGPFGFIEVAGHKALVFADPPLAAWDPTSTTSSQHFFFLSGWDTLDTDGLLDRVKAQAQMKLTDILWSVPSDGVRMIYAGDDPAGSTVGRIDIPTLAGEYRLSTGEYNVAGDGHVIVLRFDRSGKQSPSKWSQQLQQSRHNPSD